MWSPSGPLNRSTVGPLPICQVKPWELFNDRHWHQPLSKVHDGGETGSKNIESNVSLVGRMCPTWRLLNYQTAIRISIVLYRVTPAVIQGLGLCALIRCLSQANNTEDLFYILITKDPKTPNIHRVWNELNSLILNLPGGCKYTIIL